MYALLTCLSTLFRLLPRKLALGVGACLGWVWYRLIPIRKKVALDNLRRALPGRSDRERKAIARAMYGQLARSAVELLRLPGLTRETAEALVDIQGLEHLEQALANGKGAIVVTAHFGNFDLLACAAALRGIDLHVVTRTQHQRGVNRFWMKIRARTGLGLLSAKDSILKIHRLLKKNAVIALVIDQHMPVGRGIPVPFFGRPASTTHAPATLALATSAPILPVTVERLPGGLHRASIEPPRTVTAGDDRAAAIQAETLALNRWLEDRIRQRPDHWLWIHRRWKL